MGFDFHISYEGGRFSNIGLFKRSFNYKGLEHFLREQFPKADFYIAGLRPGGSIDLSGMFGVDFKFSRPGYISTYTTIDIYGAGPVAFVAATAYFYMLCDMKVKVETSYPVSKIEMLKEEPAGDNSLPKIYRRAYSYLASLGHNARPDLLKRAISKTFRNLN